MIAKIRLNGVTGKGGFNAENHFLGTNMLLRVKVFYCTTKISRCLTLKLSKENAICKGLQLQHKDEKIMRREGFDITAKEVMDGIEISIQFKNITNAMRCFFDAFPVLLTL